MSLSENLLPAFDPESENITPVKAKQKHELHQAFYPTPEPSSSVVDHLSPDSGTSRSLRKPLVSITTVLVPLDGHRVTIGRSSQSCTYSLSCTNRQVSRVHVRLQYVQSSQVLIVECLGWNSIFVRTRNGSTQIRHNQCEELKNANGALIDIRGERVVVHIAHPDSDDTLSDIPTPVKNREAVPHNQDKRFLSSWHNVPEPSAAPAPAPALTPATSSNIATVSSPIKGVTISEDADVAASSSVSAPQLTKTAPAAGQRRKCIAAPNAAEVGSQNKKIKIALTQIKKADAAQLEEKKITTRESEKPKTTDKKVRQAIRKPAEVPQTEQTSLKDSKKLDNDPPKALKKKHMKDVKTNATGVSKSVEREVAKDAFKDVAKDVTKDVVEDIAKDTDKDIAKDDVKDDVKDDQHELDDETQAAESYATNVINHLAYSRLASTPLSAIKDSLSVDISISELQEILTDTACIGVIHRQGKDAAGKPLESEYYYIPENDSDTHRRFNVEQLRGHSGLRSCRKQHKQYFWRKPHKR
ncbi:hypothetical protein CANCADRAFT_4037 [Tortispora caseinolytica NRRL Y-17796]|uniref:FHA domain-containing protein n=1 Tax=Tortispora caseinolytica NRRL Y-17796 TaxID=767744 RepID=A0A1E4TCH3_9ASCO|nr:hypothetical protein CANCADRAFT_4037 [Tortispora caseinolytica NRRL Y-17796]